ncbi:MAG: peptidylprolyl isomerase [Fibrobacter sp.]|nr:peptidylprolyl isomerase [Fibrobacter sp.]
MSAKKGDTVRVLYTGRLKDETVFDSSDGIPMEFTIGEGMVIPGFENAVIGMNIGQHKTIEVPSELAYGPHMDELVATVNREQFPPALEPQKGKQVRVANQLGQTFIMTIIEVADGTVTLDANHPLAGKDLIFDIDLIEIV